MDTYLEYKYICTELQLEPINREVYEEIENCIQYTPNGLKEIIIGDEISALYHSQSATNHDNFISFPIEFESPCIFCAETKISLIDKIYTEVDKCKIEKFSRYATLVSVFSLKHRIPFSYTENFSEQPWSVVFPLPGCPHCSKKKKFTWKDAREKSILEVINKKTTSDNTSGIRHLSPVSFIKNNRYAIGYSSILANPGQENNRGIFLTNSFIYTGESIEKLETAGGKGYSSEQSLASWLGEGLERYYLDLRCSNDTFPKDLKEKQKNNIINNFKLPAIMPGSLEEINPYKTQWPYAEVKSLFSNKTELAPRSLIFCPDEVPENYISATTSSTNGAASGSNIQEAIIQGILELIERDSFWFYCRTDATPFAIPNEFIPNQINNLISLEKEGKFFIQLLKSPFNIHVVQTTYMRNNAKTNESHTARGTGASHSLEKAIYRSFSECIQILDSLDTGESIDLDDFDMRRLWHSGESIKKFKNFFTDSLPTLDNKNYLDFTEPSLGNLFLDSYKQGIKFFYYILHSDENISIVKSLGNEINSLDSEFYKNSNRLYDFSLLINNPFREIIYNESTFM
ncbi:hypothetical protein E4U03_11540 [Rothia nasimurium]|uniref:YcaO domain-containing protein n=1 Tax=Rothia nasimurium TaxID=85336 RepID=A0A4Y9F302_9MICC|nr:YcaO-like family protein [Rothia nasimurium]MBF0809234.1 YcaO-like family protein [Rothia nasimurium]TFU20375.1 hypothetical protein E4U03_11540 [Rothia nasimurium]